VGTPLSQLETPVKSPVPGKIQIVWADTWATENNSRHTREAKRVFMKKRREIRRFRVAAVGSAADFQVWTDEIIG
jgi:hypothetical protein